MATNFMAASRMKILRLFIDNDLSHELHWQIYSSDSDISEGRNLLVDIAGFEFDNIEAYINTNNCSIFTLNVGDINDRRLTEELLLGMLEERLVDDIEDVRAILLRLADGVAHVAIFNRDFYTRLIDDLQSLNKPIKFLQPIAFILEFKEKHWTVCIQNHQAFVRTSLYEYYLLDDKRPLPQLLEDMLAANMPSGIILYADDESLSQTINEKFGIECIASQQYDWGISVWNFYNPKSKKFQLKLEDKVKVKLVKSSKYFGYFMAVLFAFWLINVVVMAAKQISLNHTISSELNGIVPVNNIRSSTISAANTKLDELKHQKVMYNNKDMVALFSIFLKIVSNSNGMITGVNYDNGKLSVLLTGQFDPSDFASSRAIFATKGISAIISDYKEYKEANAKNSDTSNTMANDDAAWVITLQ